MLERREFLADGDEVNGLRELVPQQLRGRVPWLLFEAESDDLLELSLGGATVVRLHCAAEETMAMKFAAPARLIEEDRAVG